MEDSSSYIEEPLLLLSPVATCWPQLTSHDKYPLLNPGATAWFSIFRDQSSLKCRQCSQGLKFRHHNPSEPGWDPDSNTYFLTSASPCQTSRSQHWKGDRNRAYLTRQLGLKVVDKASQLPKVCWAQEAPLHGCGYYYLPLTCSFMDPNDSLDLSSIFFSERFANSIRLIIFVKSI